MSTIAEESLRGQGRDADGRRRGYLEIRREQHELVADELREQFGDDRRIDPSEDHIRWRRAIRSNPVTGTVWRVGVFVVGLALVAVGIPMVPLVGPGWVVIFFGLYLWSTEFFWARRITQLVKAEVKTFDQWARNLPWKAKVPLTLVSIVFGWSCCWVALLITGVPSWMPDVVERYLRMLPGLG